MKTRFQFPGATGILWLGVMLLLSFSAEALEGGDNMLSVDHQEDQPQIMRSQGFCKNKDVADHSSGQDLRHEDLGQMEDDADSNDEDDTFEARNGAKRNFIPPGYIPVRGRRGDLGGLSRKMS